MTRLDRAERALWLKLAKLWDKPEDKGHSDGVFVNVVSRHDGIPTATWGLCESIAWMEPEQAIRRRADDRIKSEFGMDAGWYVWPCDAEGAKSRAAFCRRQAAALAGKKGK